MHQIVYREIVAEDEEAVIAFVRDVLSEFAAPDYEEDGIKDFFAPANACALKERMQNDRFVLVARRDSNLVGALKISLQMS